MTTPRLLGPATPYWLLVWEACDPCAVAGRSLNVLKPKGEPCPRCGENVVPGTLDLTGHFPVWVRVGSESAKVPDIYMHYRYGQVEPIPKFRGFWPQQFQGDPSRITEALNALQEAAA